MTDDKPAIAEGDQEGGGADTEGTLIVTEMTLCQRQVMHSTVTVPRSGPTGMTVRVSQSQCGQDCLIAMAGG